MIPDAVAAFAEDPPAAGPDPAPESGFRRILDDRFCVFLTGTSASVSRLRLAEDEVEAAVAEVRRLTADAPRPVSWWIGESARPADLAERLVALGLEPATAASWEPVATAMATVTPPPEPETAVVARRVRSYDEFALAGELGWETFDVPADERERSRALLPERWPAERAGLGPAVYLAWLDGEPVGVARAHPYPDGSLLLGGAVRPDARGRGAYRALVRARWDDAVARGAPALAAIAGAMSRPILERLGFEPVSRIDIFLDGRSG